MSPLPDAIIVALQLGGLILSFSMGLLAPRNRMIAGYLILLGIGVNLVIQLPQGGPGLCLGMIFLPIMFGVAALLGRGARQVLEAVGWIEPERIPLGPTCPGCGYLLIGLPGRTCPECGRALTDAELRGDPNIIWRRQR